jgi:precorrin-6B methylase 2
METTQVSDYYKAVLGIARKHHDRQERWLHLSDLIASHWTGDFCELGSGAGSVTVKLCAAARKHRRRVIAVDDFWRDEAMRGTFYQSVKPYRDLLEIHEGISHDPPIAQAIMGRSLALALVGGSNAYEHVLANMITVANAHVIAVLETAVEPSVAVVARLLGREVHKPADYTEYFLVRE